MTYATIIDDRRRLKLADIDPADTAGLTERDALDRLGTMTDELRELQELLFAAEKHAVLVILQGMDAAGKDVTIANVFAAATPEAIRVKHFTSMTDEESAHDFLWRTHLAAPEHGELVIFDRSYFEQVILPQVEGEATDAETQERCDDVQAFERILRHGGTLVVKVFLHVSADEQERRLVERMESPDTAWKISANDWIARRSWDAYMRAYETTINLTATREEPWYVVPADHQWFHNLAVAELLVERMREHRETWTAERERIGAEKRKEAEREAPADVSA